MNKIRSILQYFTIWLQAHSYLKTANSIIFQLVIELRVIRIRMELLQKCIDIRLGMQGPKISISLAGILGDRTDLHSTKPNELEPS